MPPQNSIHGLSFWRFAALSLGCWLVLRFEPRAAAEEFDFFENKIRPVLIERCYKCHSAASEKLKGELLLDTRAGMLRGGESGKPAIVQGDARQSRLIEAIRYQNEDLKMPPKKRLPDDQIADFVAWVNMGAPDPRTEKLSPSAKLLTVNPQLLATQHWAFQPTKEYPVPRVKNKQWPASPIDHFILAKLEEKELLPSPAADKRVLIRRATYDLTGLPPMLQETQEFVEDASVHAFARVVERLLASPRYGERWGRFWLDVARYADTKGYVYTDREEGRFVHSYSYRDWVIRAFNEDLPYDQFLVQQIAADQLQPIHRRPASTNNWSILTFQSPASDPSLAAMGFLTLGRRFLGVTHDIIDDRIDVLMRGTQGLTVSCARCHDHKFDPIPTRDYYSLYGVFAGCTEKTVPLAQASEADAGEFEKGLKERVDKYSQILQKKREEFSNRFRAKAADYLVAALDAKKLPSEEFYEIRGPDDLNPTIVRNWESYLLQRKSSAHPVFAPWHTLAALPSKEFAGKASFLLQEMVGGKDTSDPINLLVMRSLTETPPQSMRDLAERYGKLLAHVHQSWQGIVQAAITNKTALPLALPNSDEEELRQVLYNSASPVSIPVLAAGDLEWYFDEATRVELGKLHAEIERWIINSRGSPAYAVILEDRPLQRNPRVFLRGNPANKGEEVPRQFLEVVTGKNRDPFKVGSGRLEMAQWIASEKNPLTARVMVNRIWLHHFGAGLVRTPSDFGTRSEPPSHLELLDWLTGRFITDGWSIKQMHRLIMLSSVYQQRSDINQLAPESSQTLAVSGKSESKEHPPQPTELSPAQVDPENRLLWRMNRQRLDFESMRDSLLAVSGQLDLRMKGKAAELTKRPFHQRRTVYGYIDRQFLPGVFRVFDFANPDMHAPQRYNTTVPQQALFFMNGPFVVEQARALTSLAKLPAMRESVEGIRKLYELVYQHEPTLQQEELGMRFINMAKAEPLPELPKPVISPWLYGFGEYNEKAQRIESFQPLPHFTGEAWQGGPEWPDPKLGWVQIKAEGGHAGNDLAHAAIRRWIAPQDGLISITGTIQHSHKEGDGIRARIVSSRAGQLGSWTLHNKKEEPKLESIELKRGDTIDFVVDNNANLNSDDFIWVPVLTIAEPSTANSSGDYMTEWNGKKDFSGPPEPPVRPLEAWEKYAQVLLLSNEFIFVD